MQIYGIVFALSCEKIKGSRMNKIVMNVGMLFFFLSIIFFSQMNLSVVDVLIRSFAIFIFLTGMLAILALVVIRSINKRAFEKENDLSENLGRK